MAAGRRIALLILLLTLLTWPASAFADDEPKPAILVSLSISPTPEGWNPGAVAGEFFIGGFIPGSPQQVTLVPLAEDPEATLTVNGQAGASGGTFVVVWEPLVPWLDIPITIVEAEGATGQYLITLVKRVEFPQVVVTPYFRMIAGERFNPGGATLTVRSGPGGSVLVTAPNPAPRREGAYYWDFNALGIPLVLTPGMEVTISDGQHTVRTTVVPFGITEVDATADIVRGTGLPGGAVELFIWPNGPSEEGETPPDAISVGRNRLIPPEEPEYDPRFFVDETGAWEINVGELGIDLMPESLIDGSLSFIPGINWAEPSERGGFNPNNFERGHTMDFWPHEVPTPGLYAIQGLNVIGIDGVMPGLPVAIEVRSGPGGEVLFSGSAVTDAEMSAGWGGDPGPPLGIDLQPGMEIKVTFGETSLTETVIDLSIEIIEAETERVSGMAPPNAILTVVALAEAGGTYQAFGLKSDITADAGGHWEVDFNGEADITPGTLVVAMIQGEHGVNGCMEVAVTEPDVQEENVATAEVVTGSDTSVATNAADGSAAQVTASDGALPPGSTLKAASIANRDDLISQVTPPAGTNLVLGFTVSATDAEGADLSEGFAAPVDLSFTVAGGAVPQDTPPEELKVAFWNGIRWAALQGIEVNENPDGSVTLLVTTDHFTVFSLMTDGAGQLRPGSANPLGDLQGFSLNSAGLVAAPAEDTEDESTGGSLPVLPVAVGGGAVVLVLAGLTVLWRRRRRG